MVKFGRELKNSVVTEWALQYLAYDFLKSILYETIDEEEKEGDDHRGDATRSRRDSTTSSDNGSLPSSPIGSVGGPASIAAVHSPRSTLSQKLQSAENLFPLIKKISNLVEKSSTNNNNNNNSNDGVKSENEPPQFNQISKLYKQASRANELQVNKSNMIHSKSKETIQEKEDREKFQKTNRAMKRILDHRLPPTLEFDPMSLSLRDIKFFVAVYDELVKIDTFFTEQSNAFQKKLDGFLDKMNKQSERESNTKNLRDRFKRTISSITTTNTTTRDNSDMTDLTAEAEDLYLHLDRLKSYLFLNVTALQKILKKFDKISKLGVKEHYMEFVTAGPFNCFTNATQRQLKRYEQQLEEAYTTHFCGGNRKKAMSVLKVPKTQKSESGRTVFFTGVFFGACLASIWALCYLCWRVESTVIFPNFNESLLIYVCCMCPVLMLWGYGINAMVWRKARIDFITILQFNVRKHLTHHSFFFAAGLYTTVLLVSSVIYVLQSKGEMNFGIPAQYIPWGVMMGLIISLFVPFNILMRKSRYWLLKMLFEVITAPFSPVTFRHSFVGDQLTSLTLVFGNIPFLCCYAFYGIWFLEGPLVCSITHVWMKSAFASLPFIWRLLQCCRQFKTTGQKLQIANGIKYILLLDPNIFLGLTVLSTENIWSEFRIVWAVCYVTAVCYAQVWDIRYDWGLTRKQRKHFFLREKLMYKQPWIYYTVMTTNFIMRSVGLLVLIPLYNPTMSIPLPIFSFCLAVNDILRRTIWNCFRLEYKHVHDITVQKAMYKRDMINIDLEDYEVESLTSTPFKKPIPKGVSTTTVDVATAQGDEEVTLETKVLSENDRDMIEGFVI